MTRTSSMILTSGPFKRTCVKYCGVYRHIIIFFIILCRTKCQQSTSVKDFYKFKQNSQVSTSNSFVLSRSLLECAQYCFPTEHCCGFNFNKIHRSCTFLYDFDLTYPNLKYETDSSVYILKTCDFSEISSTTKDVPATSSPQPTTTTTTTTTILPSVINDDVRSTTITSKLTLTTGNDRMTSSSTQPQTTTPGDRMTSSSTQTKTTAISSATPPSTTPSTSSMSEDSRNDDSKNTNSNNEDSKDSKNEDSENEELKDFK